MASISITGTVDEIRAIGKAIEHSASSGTGTRQVTVSIDNAPSSGKALVTGPDGTQRRCG
jgi:hypothetical protein